MVTEIIFSFFAAFGILQFFMLIWDLFTRPMQSKNAAVLYAPDESQEDILLTLKNLSKSRLPILIRVEDEQKEEMVKYLTDKMNAELLNETQLNERITLLWKH